jgi:ferrochelatase
MASNGTALLLVNLGTPGGPSPAELRPYLREFLMDPQVIDVPTLQRWLIVHLLILPFRPRKSAEAYGKIWTPEGSPLLIHGRELAAKVQQRIGGAVHVALAMRYGNPSIAAALGELRERGVDRVVLFPLYPQYSAATTGSTVERVREEAEKVGLAGGLEVVPPFHDDPDYIECMAAIARPYVDRVRPELVFFSFHGLPERQILKGDRSGAHCLQRTDCCARIDADNRDCYRAQCFASARLLAERLELPEEQRVVCFQSRLGRAEWIRPYTDEILADAASGGCRRALILSPAFVADCLETLEELGMRGAQIWKENGGELLQLVPCLNASDDWADAVVRIARLSGGTERDREETDGAS